MGALHGPRNAGPGICRRRGEFDGSEKQLGATVRELRKAAGLGQRELAEKSGIAKQAITNIERGATLPTLRTLSSSRWLYRGWLPAALGEVSTRLRTPVHFVGFHHKHDYASGIRRRECRPLETATLKAALKLLSGTQVDPSNCGARRPRIDRRTVAFSVMSARSHRPGAAASCALHWGRRKTDLIWVKDARGMLSSFTTRKEKDEEATVAPAKFPASERSYDDLVDEFSSLIEAMEGVFAEVSEQGGEKLSELKEQAQASLRKAKARLGTVEKSALAKARRIASESDDYVHDNPWTAIGVAAGIGLLLGLLIGRR